MTSFIERASTIEVPVELLESVAARDLTATLVSTGEVSAQQAGRFTRGMLQTMLVQIGEWYARVMSGDIEAVMRLREDLTVRYRETLKAVSGQQGISPERIDLGAYQRLFNEMVGYIDDIADANGYFEREPVQAGEGFAPDLREVPALEGDEGGLLSADEPAASIVDDPTPQRPQRREWNSAEAASDRDLSRILRRLDPARGNLSAQRTLVIEFAEVIRQRYLAVAGIETLRVERQPASGAHLAADIELSHLDPVRDLGYEIVIELPAEFQLGGQETIKPDGWSFAGDTFEFLEWKEPESLTRPAGYYHSPEGQLALLTDLEIRGRLAERLPACRGWRYGTRAGWLADVVDWAVTTLQGLKDPGEPPVGITDAMINAVNILAATDPTWAGTIRVAP